MSYQEDPIDKKSIVFITFGILIVASILYWQGIGIFELINNLF